MGEIGAGQVTKFFEALAKRHLKPATILLLGGGGLAVLGNMRPTLDIDYDIEAAPEEKVELETVMQEVAAEEHLELEFVPIEEFIPLPEGAKSRRRLIGQFGQLSVYLYDPYSIALSKVARGLETDIQDVVFMINEKIIMLAKLEEFVQDAVLKALQFDIESRDLHNHLAAIKQLAQKP